MDVFYKTHKYLVEHINMPIRRGLMDEFDPKSRLIAVKGYRGVGKTSLLLSFAKENFHPADKRCLYINLNNFYFTKHTIRDFAKDFIMKGGQVLLIDQIFKYPEWWKELSFCYENFHELKIIIASSSVISFDNPTYDLDGKVDVYHLRGFSFREFLEISTGFRFKPLSLNEILDNHQEIAASVCAKVKPLAYIEDYLHHGFYPFFLEKKNFSENLLKTANMMLEVDLLTINQMEKTYLPKIRKLLYLLALQNNKTINISQLSEEISISRNTVMNYIKYLKDARLVNLLYPEEDILKKKPSKLYVHNPNLLQVMRRPESCMQLIRETFFYNQIYPYPVHSAGNKAHFLVDRTHLFNVGERILGKFNPEIYYTISDIEMGERKIIPLWLFGFLY
ncbi:MAG: AAA family ATPase [Dysgonamonadaceae bacterium]|jgi:predicted AAA+ superfamily ATPase|nr:AAA family ATPase [Dysgonamonadaceae bacterium]